MKWALIVAVLAIVVGSAQAQTTKEKYDLAERCGKRTAEVFAKEWPIRLVTNSDGSQTSGGYENHYNARLNKCMYLEISQTSGRKGINRFLRLFDINENREIATYIKTAGNPLVHCQVQEKICRTEEEWRQLI